MFGKSEEKNINNAESIIGPSVTVKGDFNSKGDVIIEGNLQGKINSNGRVVIGPNAKIKADTKAESADVSGKIEGNLVLKGELIIKSGAKINGDVKCSSISIEEGGILNGKCDMLTDESETKEEKPKEEKKNFEIT